MVKTRFETLIDRELDKNVQAILKVPLGDMMRHALIKGERQGLERALTIYRNTMMGDHEEDAA